jgi:hypothetical protein
MLLLNALDAVSDVFAFDDATTVLELSRVVAIKEEVAGAGAGASGSAFFLLAAAGIKAMDVPVAPRLLTTDDADVFESTTSLFGPSNVRMR